MVRVGLLIFNSNDNNNAHYIVFECVLFFRCFLLSWFLFVLLMFFSADKLANVLCVCLIDNENFRRLI